MPENEHDAFLAHMSYEPTHDPTEEIELDGFDADEDNY